MIVDTSKVIVFVIVAAAAIGGQMYRDNMSTAYLRLNIENGLLIAILAIIFLMLHESINTIVEGIDNIDPASSIQNSNTTITPHTPTDNTTSLATSPTTATLVNGATMTTQTMGSPVVIPPSSSPAMEPSVSQATPTDILNAPMEQRPTGQPSTIQDTVVNRAASVTSGVVSEEELQPMVENSAPISVKNATGSNVKIVMESDDPDQDAIEVDVSVSGSNIQKLQKNVKSQLNKLVNEGDKDEGHKYVLSDPALWVNENIYKVNVLSKCEICPVVTCDQNFMSV